MEKEKPTMITSPPHTEWAVKLVNKRSRVALILYRNTTTGQIIRPCDLVEVADEARLQTLKEVFELIHEDRPEETPNDSQALDQLEREIAEKIDQQQNVPLQSWDWKDYP